MSDDPTIGLPPDLARVLRDQSIIVPQDQAVFEAIAKDAEFVVPCAECGEPLEKGDEIVPRWEDGRMVHGECS